MNVKDIRYLYIITFAVITKEGEEKYFFGEISLTFRIKCKEDMEKVTEEFMKNEEDINDAVMISFSFINPFYEEIS